MAEWRCGAVRNLSVYRRSARNYSRVRIQRERPRRSAVLSSSPTAAALPGKQQQPAATTTPTQNPRPRLPLSTPSTARPTKELSSSSSVSEPVVRCTAASQQQSQKRNESRPSVAGRGISKRSSVARKNTGRGLCVAVVRCWRWKEGQQIQRQLAAEASSSSSARVRWRRWWWWKSGAPPGVLARQPRSGQPAKAG